MSEFNFNSQVCTSKIQSEKLIALGLKKETADMYYEMLADEELSRIMPHTSEIDYFQLWDSIIPAWSLHRLIEMIPRYVHTEYNHYKRTLFADVLCYYKELYNDCGEDLIAFDSPNLYDRIINMYEWLIKERYFNDEYLV